MDEPLTQEQWHDYFTRTLEQSEKRLARLEVAMQTNTQIIQTIKVDTSEFLEVFKAMKGGFKVLGWLGAAAKWIATLGGALLGLWFVIKGK